jgi:NAD(P)-dependent dehydrogenase (short-subunit alcohol dehydrogenase family)
VPKVFNDHEADNINNTGTANLWINHGNGLPPTMCATSGDPAIPADRMRFIPMHRPGAVDELANAILFLASEKSSYITGSEIRVDGGAIAL